VNFDIIILAKQLDELTRCVIPVVYQLRRITPDSRLIVMLLPSQESHRVVNVANKLEGVSLVLKPEESLNFLTKGKFPLNFPIDKQGAILSLTNNQVFAVNFSWRTNFPIFAYTDKYTFWHRWIYKIFLSNEMIYAQYRLKKIIPSKLDVIGDLTVDAINPSLLPLEARLQFKLNPKIPVIAIIPDNNIKIIPFYFKIIEKIHKKYPNVQFIMPTTPFIVPDEISNQNLIRENGYYYIKLNEYSVQLLPATEKYNAYQVADLAITPSPIVTEELTTMGVPMIFASSMSSGQQNNKLINIPVIGKYFSKPVSNITDFISFPNIKSPNMLIPEYRDIDFIQTASSPLEDIVNKTIELLNSHHLRREMTIKLKEYARPAGASERVVKILMQDLKNIYSSQGKQYFKNKKELKEEKLN